MSERANRSLPAEYFDALYARDPDPWRFETSDYERGKYDATLAALPCARYARALEVGCSIGVLTADLAPRCEALLALDAAEAPLRRARERLAGQPHVAFALAGVPAAWPEDAAPFDLILLSEVVYYLSPPDVERLAARVAASLAPGGDVLLVHWTGETDYPLSGDEAVERFVAASPGLEVRRAERAERYRLDLLQAPGLRPPAGR
ncbi:methyltransferase domain-containing protein [Roseomonas nepalensis]|uniref:Methyltransferase domain-containing protein n=1 Tax=Muricoccus nepalensis TaxID=1854500 RepID=A0A502G773_9PROT|nr:SAM-dependent methyltransferase [Roseomonas nepalensis]TPG57719.1 methyltransferase domain-containing protein [Roseomonas nepalensis]